MTNVLRPPAEALYAQELECLIADDKGRRPHMWALSPQSVLTYLMGGKTSTGAIISPKYVGDRRLMETAVATLATDRALLLLGVPGTAKSWVSEHLAAAITGDSTMIIQCTAGTDETQVRYGWNYARLLAQGPSEEAIVPTPLYQAMQEGKLCRMEELTRCGSEVQDTLITILSEKMMPISELNTAIYAKKGFNLIATANNRDKGVNELSSALKRRFNVVILPLPASRMLEVQIVAKRVEEMAVSLELPLPGNIEKEIERVVTIFRELREGETTDRQTTLKKPSGTLSTAEAIGTMIGGLSQAAWFEDGRLSAESLSPSILGAIVKDPVQDKIILQEYLETILKHRREFDAYYSSLNDMV